MGSILLGLMSNWRLILSTVSLVSLVSLGAGLYVKGRLDAKHKIEITNLKIVNEQLHKSIQIANEAIEADAAKAASDDEALDRYERKLDALTSKLKDAEHECLSADDTDGLRGLWNKD